MPYQHRRTKATILLNHTTSIQNAPTQTISILRLFRIYPLLFTLLLTPSLAADNKPSTGAEAAANLTTPKEATPSNALSTNNAQLLNCSRIFELRKDEVKAQLDELDERSQALQVLQNATQVLLDEKERQLKAKEEEIDKKILVFAQEQEKSKAQIEELNAKNTQELEARTKELESLIAKNEQMIEQIQKLKDDKIVQAYKSMKEAKAAAILSGMPESEAVEILSKMEVRDMTKILGKMEDNKAAQITSAIRAMQPSRPQEPSLTLPPKQDSTTSPNSQAPQDQDQNLEQNFIQSQEPQSDKDPSSNTPDSALDTSMLDSENALDNAKDSQTQNTDNPTAPSSYQIPGAIHQNSAI